MKIELHQFFRLSRELQRIKQTELAGKVGITQPALNKFENGHSTLSEKTLLSLAPLININPDFVIGHSSNPFQSKNLIKMFLPETFTQIDFSIFKLLLKVNSSLNILFLIPTLKPVFIEKILHQTVFEPPVCAICVKDQDNNFFIFFKRSKKGLFFVGSMGVQAELMELCQQEGKEIDIKPIKISRGLYEKIIVSITADVDAWTVDVSDVKGLFIDAKKILSSGEKAVIEEMRKSRINPDIVIQYIKKERI